MAVTIYYIQKQAITGTEDLPQTITYNGLTDYITGEDLDTILSDISTVDVVNNYQETKAKVVSGSITTTQFQVAMSDLGTMPQPSIIYADIRIIIED